MSAIAPGKVSLVIGNTLAEMEKVVDLVDHFGAAHGIDRPIVNDLNLCLDELLNNTISYGYDDEARHEIGVELSVDGAEWVVEIRDDGRPFDPRRLDMPAPGGPIKDRKIGGLGIRFVKTLMDDVDYVRSGRYNVLTLRKKLPGEASGGNR